MIMGRMCSQIAKFALLGEHIVVINSKDCVISGRRNQILEKYVHLRRDIRNLSNPRRGPFHGSRPDTFLRQKMRYMLPKNHRGREALHRIHVYIAGIPKAKENKYQNNASNFVLDSKRVKGRILSRCNPFRNAEASAKDKQDWIIYFFRTLRYLNRISGFQPGFRH